MTEKQEPALKDNSTTNDCLLVAENQEPASKGSSATSDCLPVVENQVCKVDTIGTAFVENLLYVQNILDFTFCDMVVFDSIY